MFIIYKNNASNGQQNNGQIFLFLRAMNHCEYEFEPSIAMENDIESFPINSILKIQIIKMYHLMLHPFMSINVEGFLISLISGKCCMVQLVACLHKFKLEINNYQGPHRYGISMQVILLFDFPYLLWCSDQVWNQDIKSEINPVLNPRAAVPEGSLIGIPGILCLTVFSFVSFEL